MPGDCATAPPSRCFSPRVPPALRSVGFVVGKLQKLPKAHPALFPSLAKETDAPEEATLAGLGSAPACPLARAEAAPTLGRSRAPSARPRAGRCWGSGTPLKGVQAGGRRPPRVHPTDEAALLCAPPPPRAALSTLLGAAFVLVPPCPRNNRWRTQADQAWITVIWR